MSVKTNPITLANGIFNTGTTFTLSTIVPVLGMDLKRETFEATLVFNVLTLSGTSPTLQFDVDEFVDGQWVHVGQTSSFTGTGVAVIDSGGGSTSTGSSTFSSSSNLRLLGKGIDTRVRTTVGGTIGTAQFSLQYIGYQGD